MGEGKPEVDKMVILALGPWNIHSAQPSGESARVSPGKRVGCVVNIRVFSQ